MNLHRGFFAGLVSAAVVLQTTQARVSCSTRSITPRLDVQLVLPLCSGSSAIDQYKTFATEWANGLFNPIGGGNNQSVSVGFVKYCAGQDGAPSVEPSSNTLTATVAAISSFTGAQGSLREAIDQVPASADAVVVVIDDASVTDDDLQQIGATSKQLRVAGTTMYSVTRQPEDENLALRIPIRVGDAIAGDRLHERSISLNSFDDFQFSTRYQVSKFWHDMRFPVSSQCLVMGRGHYTTFDGTNFDFQGYGVFDAVKSSVGSDLPPFEVQVRQTACGDDKNELTIPSDGTTCIYAFAIRSAPSRGAAMSEIVVEYMRSGNVLRMVYDGQEVDLSTTLSMGPFSWELEAFESPEGGWSVFVEDSNSGNNVYFEFNAASGSLSYINLAFKYAQEVEGLCGNFDSCSLNDIVNQRNGTIVDQATLANPQVFYPAVLAAAESWRTPQGSSLFSSMVNQQYRRVPTYRPLYESKAESTSTDCEMAPSGVARDTCNFDVSLGGASAAWPTRAMMAWQCHEYCAYGSTNSFLLENPWHACFCGAEDGVDLFENLGANRTRAVMFDASMQTTSFLRVAMGGTYTLQRGLSGPMQKVDVQCGGAVPTLSAGEPQTVSSTFTGSRRVQLQGSLGFDLQYPWRVQWKAVSWPTRTVDEMVYGYAPAIREGNTLSPWLLLSQPGLYNFTLAATDGCQVWHTYTTVELNCTQCSAMNNLTMTQSEALRPVSSGKLSASFVVNLPPVAAPAAGFAVENSVLPMPNSPNDPEQDGWEVVVKKTATNMLGLRTASISNSKVEYTIRKTNQAPSQSGSTVMTPQNARAIRTEQTSSEDTSGWHSFKKTMFPFNEFSGAEWGDAIVTSAYSYFLNDTNSQVVVANYTDYCDVELTITQSANNAWTAQLDVSALETDAQLVDSCLNILKLQYGVLDTCEDSSELDPDTSETVSVTSVCGRPPVAVPTQCEMNAKWDATSQAWQPVQLDAADSFVAFENVPQGTKPSMYRWKLVSDVPEYTGAREFMTASATFTPDVNGEYTWELMVADGCQWSEPVRVTVHADAAECGSSFTMNSITAKDNKDGTGTVTVSFTKDANLTVVVSSVAVQFENTAGVPEGFPRPAVSCSGGFTSSDEYECTINAPVLTTYSVAGTFGDQCIGETKQTTVTITQTSSTTVDADIDLDQDTPLFVGETVTLRSNESEGTMTTSFWWVSKYPTAEPYNIDTSAWTELSGCPPATASGTTKEGELACPGKERPVHFVPQWPGDYEITLMVQSGRRFDTTTRKLEVGCSPLVLEDADIEVVDDGSLRNNDTLRVQIKPAQVHRFPAGIDWMITSQDGFVVYTANQVHSIAFALNSVGRGDLTILATPSQPNLACRATTVNVAPKTKTVSVSCASGDNDQWTASAKDATQEVAYSNGNFASVDLQVALAGLGGKTEAELGIDYVFQVTQAPNGSVWAEQTGTYNQTNSTLDSLTFKPRETDSTTVSLVEQIDQSFKAYPVVLPTSGQPSSARCFRPDLFGEYTIEAHVQDSASSRTCLRRTVTFTVKATCTTLEITVDGTKELSIAEGSTSTMTSLQAAASGNNGDVYYSWAINRGDEPEFSVADVQPNARMSPDDGVYDSYAQVIDLNAFNRHKMWAYGAELTSTNGAVADLKARAPGTYDISVQASDGCQAVTSTVQITVTSKNAQEDVPRTAVRFTGAGSLGVAAIPVTDATSIGSGADMVPSRAEGQAPGNCKQLSVSDDTWYVVAYEPPAERTASSAGLLAMPAARELPAAPVAPIPEVEIVAQPSNTTMNALGVTFGALVLILLGALVILTLKPRKIDVDVANSVTTNPIGKGA